MNNILPAHTQQQDIEKIVQDNVVIGTTLGLKKSLNEDRIAVSHKNSNDLRIIITDGHWGDTASDIVAKYWLDMHALPVSRQSAVLAMQKVEKLLYDQFAHDNMDPDTYQSPETSVIICEVKNKKIKIIGYGDCRLIIARKGAKVFEYTTTPTWLGAFSHIGLRDRKPINDAIFYNTFSAIQDDVISIYSDGVDECIYEVPTISTEQILSRSQGNTPIETQFDSIIDEVFSYGAEDNASLAIIKIL